MKINITKKLELLGGIRKSPLCTDNRRRVEESFVNIEAIFNSHLPESYKDFYTKVGAFSFLELICVKCIDVNRFMLQGNKVSVGAFYCIVENYKLSVDKILSTFREQLPIGILPICDGELGDIICVSLREGDYEHIYYFHHESPPDNDLFLIAKNFEDFLMKLEVYKGTSSNDDLVKKMKVETNPQMWALLKKSGYGPKK